MIKIFGLLFFIILICLIYLHYQGKISSNIPIIFMFFLILIIPFTYLETGKKDIENYSNYDQIMNSSLDIYYTNQKSKERKLNELKKVKLIDNPIQTILVQKDIKPITLSLFTKYYSPYIVIWITSQTINENLYTNFSNQIILTYITKQNLFDQEFNSIKTRIKDYNNLSTLNTAISAVPSDTYIIIVGNNITPFKNADSTTRNTFINTFKFPDKINNLTSSSGSFIVILSKSANDSYTLINQKFTNDNNYLDITQNLIADSAYFKDNDGEQFKLEATINDFKPISTDDLINSKINVISPLNSNYSLSFTAENNESFVYLSSRQLNNQVVLYDDSEKSSTYLDTQKPQFWSFEPVTNIITSPLLVFIRTYSRPYFYLDAEIENGVMVLKASRFKAALRQQWEIIKDSSNYKIRHLKSGMYLGYSDFDGYLYKDDGSVFLSKSSNYIWNIKKILESNINRNVIESFEANRPNLLQTTENPADFGSVENPTWNISETINSKGRTVWDSTYSSIWSGKWIYNGTVETYKATLDINNVKFLIINIDQNGDGIIEDEYYKYKMNVINAGSNILTGIIPSGEYKGYRAILKMIPTDLKYSDPSKPFPIKMRYYIQNGSTILNLSSGDIKNMNGYSTKFVGDKLILSNFLEASGIQTDPNLAFSEETLQKINQNIKDKISMPSYIKIANIFMFNKIKSSRLLYKASTNGWSAQNFHKICDNRGPTITIATLKDGRFIGAFSPISWGTVNNQYINNPDAFLFDDKAKYTTNNSLFGPNQIAIYQSESIGPTFGGGHDFVTLNKFSPKMLGNNVFTFINNNTGPLGVSIRTYNYYELSDLEVYSISYTDTGDFPKPKIMHGPWIGREQVTDVVKLNDGKLVYVIYDDLYTKMVSSDGEEKYFRNANKDIQFNPSDWNSYNNTGGGKYLLK
jgi:hypothetical protein